MSKAIDIGAIKARCEAATPGHWCAYTSGRGLKAGPEYSFPEMVVVDADAAFIVQARADILALLARVKQLEWHHRCACRVMRHLAEENWAELATGPEMFQADADTIIARHMRMDKEITKLKFMVDNGLGWEDMESDA